MLVSKYDQFVQDTDQSKGLPQERRLEIAIYGLASEIGSVAAAIKKRILGEDGTTRWDAPNEEIVDELGDVIWYCFALAKIANLSKPVNIFTHDISNLRREIGANDARARTITRVIGLKNSEAFLLSARSFPRRTKSMTFQDYQTLAFLTARTKKRTLVEVCIAVLYQLSAELFRQTLPTIERKLNRSLPDRDINDILGEIAWHISALASIYKIQLGVAAEQNMKKVSYRLDRSHPTKLHDSSYPINERFPRKFQICFITVAKGKVRMYLNGKRLGDQLTDNSHSDDGYRFHDIMHLANIAKLGWSPVVRGLMGKKRRSDLATDEVEDGARAKIVEEAVIKTIHSEGERIAKLRSATRGPTRLFPNRKDVTFRFLKLIQTMVTGLEVEKNKFWEWEDAIYEGNEIYFLLRREGQGTVSIDLNRRSMRFTPDVFIALNGRVAGIGAAGGKKPKSGRNGLHESLKKRAILASLGFNSIHQRLLDEISIKEKADGQVSVKARGPAQRAMWKKKVISFRISATVRGSSAYCTAIALSDE